MTNARTAKIARINAEAAIRDAAYCYELADDGMARHARLTAASAFAVATVALRDATEAVKEAGNDTEAEIAAEASRIAHEAMDHANAAHRAIFQA